MHLSKKVHAPVKMFTVPLWTIALKLHNHIYIELYIVQLLFIAVKEHYRVDIVSCNGCMVIFWVMV